MSTRRKLSIKLKLVSMTFAIIATLSGGGLFIASKMADAARDNVGSTYELLAYEFNNAIQAQFFERYGDVQAFASNPDIRSLSRDRITQSLDFYVGLYVIYDLILVVDAKGNFVGANSKSAGGEIVEVQKLEGLNFSQAPWFQAVMNNKLTEDKEKGLVGTFVEPFGKDPFIETAFGRSNYATGFSTAIKDENGKIVGVISNRTHTKWFDSVAVDIFKNLSKAGTKSADILLVDKEGNIILDYDPSANEYKTEVVYSDEVILKRNYHSLAYEPALLVKAGKRGYGVFPHPIAKDYEVVGYAPVAGSKFVNDIGWATIVRANVDEVFATVNVQIRDMWISFGVLAFFAIAAAFFFATALSKSILDPIKELAKSAVSVTEASVKIASQGTELSEAAVEQAASIQETMSAVDEIGATAEKNADSTHRSKAVSTSSRESAVKGKKQVEQMMTAMGEINSANEEVARHMAESNRQISDIVRLINDIGNKTKVINEIVFQTKLLSFNASVEAARAGEYGKGFAVVAEEVGNLAQMSGAAAKEISEMLDNSIRQVEKIVSETQGRINSIVGTSKDKVGYGQKVAGDCRDALDSILSSVNEMDSLVNEIAQSSSEQAHGVREISTAVGQLDVVTQQNTVVSQEAAVSAEQLNSETLQLKRIVEQLSELVLGSGNLPTTNGNNEVQGESQQAKVINFKRADFAKSPRGSAPVKKVAGSGLDVPSGDDSRFEDI